MALDVSHLYRRYGDLVLGRCRNLLGDENDAREMTQEIFLRLHRYQDSFRGDASPATYLFHITTSTCLNHLRTRRRRREELVESPPAPEKTDTLLDMVQFQELVGVLLKEADPTTRTCVVYHFADGMTHQEVGELVGLSAAAVRKRIAVFRSSIQTNPPVWLREMEAA
jgi:RNA polymerase sigma-70 factor, ECF subfamily